MNQLKFSPYTLHPTYTKCTVRIRKETTKPCKKTNQITNALSLSPLDDVDAFQ